MARIQDAMLKIVFFVYPNKDAAISNEESGGTGFFFIEPIEPTGPQIRTALILAVTNLHVVFDGNYDPVLRINTKDGKYDIIETKRDQWIRHPDGDDLAVAIIGINSSHHDFEYISRVHMLTRDFIEEKEVGVGDEIAPIYLTDPS